MSGLLGDRELNAYRDLVRAPGTFEEAFGWRAILGALFVGVVMLPASMYMGIALGGDTIGEAAKWVTVILFIEMAKRARSALRPAEIFILFAMVGTLVGSPLQGFFWRQFFVQSEAARGFGLSDQFPAWYAPSDPAVLDQRSFLMWEWALPLALLFIGQVISRIDSLVLGYGLFRIASDVEKLPFPIAPLNAAGVQALSENQGGKDGWRWRCFSIGAALGLVLTFLVVGLPIFSTALGMREPLMLVPFPWLDTSSQTETLFPATATGISFDMGNFFLGMALPFFGVLGAFIALVITCIANPLLLKAGILHSWKPGMSTVDIMFKNSVDFYLSFGIGLGLAVAAIGLWQCIATLRAGRQPSFDAAAASAVQVKLKGRGDIRTVTVIATYLLSSGFYIVLCGWLLDWNFRGSALLWVLLFFALIYTPFVSYVTARLEGLAGQALDLPYIREAAFIFSGFKGIEVWLLPIPMGNYGHDVVNYRVAELVGCSFRSIWKLALFSTPLVFVLSVLYAQFIWALGPIPGPQYPYAQQLWELFARNECFKMSSTVSGFSPFMESINVGYIAAGGAVGLASYAGLASFGLPVLLLYGVVKGLGGSMPQFLLTQFAGALFGRYVMARRFGDQRWREYAVVLYAGYACGAGLLMMLATGVRFLSAAVFQLSY